MKLYLTIAAILFVSIIANAQDQSAANNQISTIFGKNNDERLGWFVDFDNGYTQFGRRDVHMTGISAGVIVNRNFALGFSGSGWTNRNSMYYPDITDTCGAYLEGGFGRFILEITPKPMAAIHLTFPLMIGWGGASLVTEQKWYEYDDDEWDTEHKVLDSDLFFSIEPGIRAEVNVLKFMRFNAGISYRFVSGFELLNTSGNLLNNYTATFGVKFGRFH